MKYTNTSVRLTEGERSTLERIRVAMGLRSYNETFRRLILKEDAEMSRQVRK